jgi:hypothetical protein
MRTLLLVLATSMMVIFANAQVATAQAPPSSAQVHVVGAETAETAQQPQDQEEEGGNAGLWGLAGLLGLLGLAGLVRRQRRTDAYDRDQTGRR